MSELLVVKNITREGPGLLHDVLSQAGITYDLIDLDQGEAFPDPRDYRAVVVLGGPDSANDSTSKMTTEINQIHLALESEIPYLGICLGLQTLVKAAGGTIVPAPEKEIGFKNPEGEQYVVELTPEGRKDPLLQGLPPILDLFQLHGETVELTETMRLLASSTACPNQIVRVQAKAYGIQSHFELTPEMLAVWASEDPDLTPLGAKTLQADFSSIQASYLRTGEILLTNFLRIAELI